MSLSFIPPAAPERAPVLGPGLGPRGEIRRLPLQLHKKRRALRLLSRSGKDMSDRFAAVIELARDLPARSLILDGELVACAEDGAPDFYGLLLRRAEPRDLWADESEARFEAYVEGRSDKYGRHR